MTWMQFSCSASLLLASVLSGCADNCEVEKISVKFNQSHSMGVALYKKNCGATTDYVYELKTVNSNEDMGDLILRFDSGHRANWARNDSKILDISWIGEGMIHVNLRVPVRVFDEMKEAGEIPIRFNYMPGTSHL